MSWQLLIWNMFVWSFTGLMIYVTTSSLWWLLLPALFTGTQNAAEIVKGMRDQEEPPTQLPSNLLDMDPKAKQEFFNLIIKTGKETNRRERL